VDGQERRTLFCRSQDVFVKPPEAVGADGAIQHHGCGAVFSEVDADGRGRRAGRRNNVVEGLQLHWRLICPRDAITLCHPSQLTRQLSRCCHPPAADVCKTARPLRWRSV